MSRTKAFLSYSHQDEEWRDRLLMHLGVLERQAWIHVWTDTRINVGDTWQTEIEHALDESRVAVLLISPAFLASPFIWNEEIPRIMRHRKAGMLVLPLIARPCAWRLEPCLASLQVRPAHGRPLSIGSPAQIDLDLTAFAYECASHLQPLSSHLAARSWEMAEQWQPSRLPSDPRSTDQSPPPPDPAPVLLPFLNVPLPLSWTGRYFPHQRLRIILLTASPEHVQGLITYLNDGRVTHIEGRIARDPRHLASESLWSQVTAGERPQVTCAIAFREMGDAQDIDYTGTYLALVTPRVMVGVWARGDAIIGHFALEIDVSENVA